MMMMFLLLLRCYYLHKNAVYDNLDGLNDNATEDDDKSPQCCAFGTGPDPTPECFLVKNQ